MAPALFRAMFSLLIRYILVIITVVIGALIFTEIENMGVEEERKKLLHKVAASKIAKHKLLTDLATRLNTTVNDSFLEEIIEKVQNLSTATVPNKWEFSTGAYFAFTIISTIGKYHLQWLMNRRRNDCESASTVTGRICIRIGGIGISICC